jgi:hypothetical protein
MRFAMLVTCGLLVVVRPAAADEVTASTDREYDRHDSILKVTLLPDEERDMYIRVFETGAGDPAINGDRIVVTIKPGEGQEQPSRTWETGININTVDKVSLKGTSILIKGTEQYVDDSGKVRTVPASYRVTYQVREGTLGDRIEVSRESGRPDSPADVDWTEYKCKSFSIRFPSTFRAVPMDAVDYGAAFISPDGSVTFQAFVSPASVKPDDMEVDTEGNAEKRVGSKVTRSDGRTVREVDIQSGDGRYSRSFVDTVEGDKRTVFGITYSNDKALQKNRPLYLKFKESLRPVE